MISKLKFKSNYVIFISKSILKINNITKNEIHTDKIVFIYMYKVVMPVLNSIILKVLISVFPKYVENGSSTIHPKLSTLLCVKET